jgi:hypothetical protein
VLVFPAVFSSDIATTGEKAPARPSPLGCVNLRDVPRMHFQLGLMLFVIRSTASMH